MRDLVAWILLIEIRPLPSWICRPGKHPRLGRSMKLGWSISVFLLRESR